MKYKYELQGIAHIWHMLSHGNKSRIFDYNLRGFLFFLNIFHWSYFVNGKWLKNKPD